MHTVLLPAAQQAPTARKARSTVLQKAPGLAAKLMVSCGLLSRRVRPCGSNAQRSCLPGTDYVQARSSIVLVLRLLLTSGLPDLRISERLLAISHLNCLGFNP